MALSFIIQIRLMLTWDMSLLRAVVDLIYKHVFYDNITQIFVNYTRIPCHLHHITAPM